MGIDISIQIGGEAGQGIQTVGQLLSLVCQKAGLYVFAINDYESRVRGGESFLQLRIADRPIDAPYHRLHLLIALDRKAYDLHKSELDDGGLVMIDTEIGVEGDSVFTLPINALAKQAGGLITANTVAASACIGLLGGPLTLLNEVLEDLFGKKEKSVMDKNLMAASLGFKAVQLAKFQWAFSWQEKEPKGIMLDGAQSIALGALASDCRFAAFYPMSPATAIMSYLVSYGQKGLPVVVEQVEDEIAAVNMAIGASFAGVRSMTATSGGGFCLMTEGLGLAAISETPLVIVNAQRPGPATGMATRTAQADLLFAIYASQDEFPRFIFAPGTINEAYDTMQKAFLLSEKYQVPSIVLVDHFFNTSLYIADKPFQVPDRIERFYVTDQEISNPASYLRFQVTPDGISPRALPCNGDALVLVTGNEHSEDGHNSEAIDVRIAMADKRMKKIAAMTKEMKPPESYYGDAEMLLLGWGSSKGAIREAVDILRKYGMDAGCLHFVDIWPFPAQIVADMLKKKKRIVMVEGNMTAQLGRIIKEQTGIAYTHTLLKYDGRPFYPQKIVDQFMQ
ncbi:MAG: 2-oxoacid:acceptor oxidoreductase subunit alpha [Desulfobacterales bacterium]|nr:2-oxoacid:acceptor oxidoreductase subunit alpha [Desulfobacterales bacterium]